MCDRDCFRDAVEVYPPLRGPGAGAAPLAGNLNYQGSIGPPPKQVKALTYPVSSDGGRTVSSRGSVSALIRRCAVNSSLS